MFGEKCLVSSISHDVKITGIDGKILHDLINGTVAFHGVNVFYCIIANSAEFLIFGGAFFFQKNDVFEGACDFGEIIRAEIVVSAVVSTADCHFLNGNVAVIGSLGNERTRSDFGSPIVRHEEFAVEIIAGNELHTFGDLSVILIAGAKEKRARAEREHQSEHFFEIHDFDFLSVEKVIFLPSVENL
jgi:hypothetical protein